MAIMASCPVLKHNRSLWKCSPRFHQDQFFMQWFLALCGQELKHQHFFFLGRPVVKNQVTMNIDYNRPSVHFYLLCRILISFFASIGNFLVQNFGLGKG